MALLSIRFFLFLLLVAVLYYALPVRFRYLVLIAASGYYYFVSSGWKNSLIFLGYIMVFTGCAAIIIRSGTSDFLKKVMYGGAMVFAVLGLLLLKYVNPWNLSAPLGMSFWMLVGIGFLTDVYRGTVTGKCHAGKILLLMGFFPLMTSGPIVRYQDSAEDLIEGHKPDYQQILFGVQRIVWGCFKKLVLSERLAVIVNTVFGDYQTYTGFYVLFAMCCFSLQLYTDFSGCMDIVLGAAQLFGITLPENFKTPFFSKNVSEFWRRWHITLGAWLKEYILYPVLHSNMFRNLKKMFKRRLGKKWGELPALYLGMFISWFLIGYWHGGEWKYIIGVGLWFWMLIVCGELLEPFFCKIITVLRINTESFSYRLFQCLRTFLLVTVGLAFFRAASVKDTLRLFKAAFSVFNPYVLLGSSITGLGLDLPDFIVLIAGGFVLLLISVLQYKGNSVRELLAKQNLVFRWFLYLLLFFAVIIFGKYGAEYNAADFIYQGF